MGSPSSPSSRPTSSSSPSSSHRQPTYPVLDEQFLPRIVAIFYSIFHPTEGAKVVYQVPEEAISTSSTQPSSAGGDKTQERESVPTAGNNRHTPLFDFKSLSEYVIPKAALCGRLISYSVASSNGQSYKILSHPIILLDQAKYPRKSFIFNVSFVFDGRADTRAYEPIVRKCARELRDLEISSSFLSKSEFRMYAVIEQLFEDLNSYCESFVALPDAPHTKYVSEALKGALQSGKQAAFPGKDPQDSSRKSVLFPNLGSPFSREATQSGEKDQSGTAGREDLANATEQSQGREVTPLSIGDAFLPAGEARPGVKRATTDRHLISSPVSPSPFSPLSPPDGSKEASMTTSRKSSDSSGIASSVRPSMGRSKTLAALAVSETTVNAMPSTTALASVDKRAEGERADPLQSGAPTSMARVASTESASTVVAGGTNGNGGLDESILSLRSVGAAGPYALNMSPVGRKGSIGERVISTSVGAVPPAAMLAPGKREPPHGLGRTVRDAINLKLFPTYPNPKDIHDWDVPVTLLDLRKRVTGNWDLTMCKVLPFIDGINHVKRIAQLADADLELTRQCIEHLVYYRCIITIDTFQFTNMYTVRPSIAVMAEDEVIISECASYVTKPGHTLPSWPRLLGLYSSLRPALTVNEWIEEHDVERLGIDVRRFVSFGVIKGFLRRVHRFPVLLDANCSPPFGGKMARTGVSPGEETEARRSRSLERGTTGRGGGQLHGGSGPAAGSPEVQSPGPGQRPRLRQPSENESTRGAATSATSGSGGRKRFGDQQPHRKTRATVMDVANVALEAAAKEHESQSMLHTPGRVSIRTPLPRGSSNATIRASAMSVSRESDEGGGGVSYPVVGAGGSQSTAPSRGTGRVKVPPGLSDLLDGTHPDDEFCVRFGMSWSEVLTILFFIGKQAGATGHRPSGPHSGPRRGTARTPEQLQEEEGAAGAAAAAAASSSGWTAGGVEGDESGIANLSGITGPGAQMGQRRSIGASLPKYRRSSTQQGGQTSMQSGFSRYASTGDGTSGWGRMSGIQSATSWGQDDQLHQSDRESMARGDLGKVKIIIK